jgi:hypothetical protein
MEHNVDPEKIRALAYQLWEEEGCPEGRSEAHWIEAENRLNLMNAFQGAVGATAEAKVQAPERGFDAEGYQQKESSRDQSPRVTRTAGRQR